MLQTSTQETIRPNPTMTEAETRKARIRELNDAFRKSPFVGRGRFMMTQGVMMDLRDNERIELVQRLLAYDDFKDSNDPHGEHDFGALDVGGKRVFWKIDYYTPDLKHGSPEPWNPAVTARVLTVMLASEY